MKCSLVLLAFVALALASSSAEARRLWQFPSLGGAPAATGAAPAATGAAPAATGAAPAAVPAAAGAGAAATTAPAAGGAVPVPGATTTPAAGAGAATTAPAAGTGPAATTTPPAAGTGASATTTAPAAGTGATVATAAIPPATATATVDATAIPAAGAQPVTATASAVGTPGQPGAAAATAGPATGLAADATGDATATAAAGDDAVTAVGEEAAEPAAPAGPKVLRPGVYVIADPPPPPKVRPVAPAAAGVAGVNGIARANATVGPPMPAPGKNLMVVMTVMGQQAKDIYKNQKALRDQVADAAGVGTDQVLFFNQTTNGDPRTGVTAMSLIMNVNCESQAQCAQAGTKLYNSSSQTRLTDALARNSISMLPGTFQVYGVQQMGKYRGNETLYENKALTTIKPKSAETDLDYNSTLSRVFAGMNDTPQPPKKGAKKGAAGADDELPLAGAALPGDIPLAGPGVFGNFSIPMDNFTMPQSSFGGMSNATLLPNTLGGGILPSDLPGFQNATEEPAPRAKSSAKSGFAAGALPLLAAAAAAAVFVL